MKALVLSGGSGTRLRPITHTSAKQLVPVANKPVLFYGLEAIADAGITDVGIIVGDTAAEIEAAVGDGSRVRPRGHLHPAAGAARPGPRGPDRPGLPRRRRLRDVPGRQLHRRRHHRPGRRVPRRTGPDAQILLHQGDRPAAVRRRRARRRPAGSSAWRRSRKQPKSDLALVGVYLFTPAIHEAVPSLKPSWRGELEITDAIQWLIDSGRDGRLHDDHRLLEGHRQRRRHAGGQPLVLETIEPRLRRRGRRDASEIIGRVVVEEGATVTGSRIVGPAIIGAGSTVIRLLHRPVHLDRRGLRDRATARSSTRSCCRGVVHPRRPPDRGLADRPRRRGDPRAPRPRGAPARARRPQQGADQLMRDPGHRRRRLHRLALRPHAPAPAATGLRGRRGHGARQAHLRRQPRQPRPGRGQPGVHVRAGRHLRRRHCSPRCCPGTTRWCNFAAESHVDRSIDGRGRLRARPTCSAPRPCSRPCLRPPACRRSCTSPPTRSTARSTTGSWTETVAAATPTPPTRPPRRAATCIARAYAPHPRPQRPRSPGAATTTARTSSREAHPAVRHQPARRQARCRCTATASTSATGCTSTTTAGASSSCSSRARPGEVYNIGGGIELTNRELTGPCCSTRCGAAGTTVEPVDGPQGPRPPLLASTTRSSASSWATPRGRRSPTA